MGEKPDRDKYSAFFKQAQTSRTLDITIYNQESVTLSTGPANSELVYLSFYLSNCLAHQPPPLPLYHHKPHKYTIQRRTLRDVWLSLIV